MTKISLASLLTLFLVSCTSLPPTTPERGLTNTPGPSTTRTAVPAEPSPAATAQSEAQASPSPKVNLDHARLLNALLFTISSKEEGQAILAEIEQSGDTRFVAGLIDTLRYRDGLTLEIGHALNTLTGQNLPPDWFEWVEWAGKHPELASFEGYVGWKANLYARIDPNFRRFLYDGVKVAAGSRPEEIVWGGVMVDGIPALDNPKMIDPAQADYLLPEERVFGVSINGDSRAYPTRFLDWHEMVNDVVGGEPVSLAY